jgi:hypothetical protein
VKEVDARHSASTFGIGEVRTQLSQIVAKDISHSTPGDTIGALSGIVQNRDAPACAVLDQKRCATLSDLVEEIHAASVAARNCGQKKV